MFSHGQMVILVAAAIIVSQVPAQFYAAFLTFMIAFGINELIEYIGKNIVQIRQYLQVRRNQIHHLITDIVDNIEEKRQERSVKIELDNTNVEEMWSRMLADPYSNLNVEIRRMKKKEIKSQHVNLITSLDSR